MRWRNAIPLLDHVIAVTICVDDLDRTARAYAQALGYREVGRSRITGAQAKTWHCPAMKGASTLLMQPESDDDFTLRFVETAPTEGYAPLQTHGWNAMELLVQDPDALAARLEGRDFTIIGMPYDLDAAGNARAMQAQGPNGEVVYLTRLKGAYAEFFGAARSFVDRGFIMVAGGPDHEAMKAFYAGLGQEIVGESDFAIKVLSRANDLPIDARYPLSSARLARNFSFELDGYPEVTRPRPRREGELPPGMAMVSVAVTTLADMPTPWRSEAQCLEGAIYEGRRVAVTMGAAGEWLECIEFQEM